MALLDIRGLTVAYRSSRGALPALRDAHLQIDPGEIVGVVGESGCGKSTLVSAILRLTPANAEIRSGEIRLRGRNILALTEREMRALRGAEIAAVFQDPMRAHNPALTVGKQMADIQHRANLSRAEKLSRAAETLAEVGIPDPQSRLSRHPHEFSGGMLQRVAIAMALLSRPALLIADEPTTALDATTEVQILDKLRELQSRRGCAVLFVSHHLNAIEELCDRVVVMYAGEVVENARVADIFRRPRHPYTRRLLECDPAARAEKTDSLPTIPGEVPDLAALPAGCVFCPRCDLAEAKCESFRPPSAAGVGAAACWLAPEPAPEMNG